MMACSGQERVGDVDGMMGGWEDGASASELGWVYSVIRRYRGGGQRPVR